MYICVYLLYMHVYMCMSFLFFNICLYLLGWKHYSEPWMFCYVQCEHNAWYLRNISEMNERAHLMMGLNFPGLMTILSLVEQYQYGGTSCFSTALIIRVFLKYLSLPNFYQIVVVLLKRVGINKIAPSSCQSPWDSWKSYCELCFRLEVSIIFQAFFFLITPRHSIILITLSLYCLREQMPESEFMVESWCCHSLTWETLTNFTASLFLFPHL